MQNHLPPPRSIVSRFAISALLALSLSGCVGLVGRDIFPSSSPLAPGVQGETYGRGTNCQYFLLWLLPLFQPPDTFAALAEAKEEANATVMTDIVIDEVLSNYILIQEHCVRVTGLGVPKSAPALN